MTFSYKQIYTTPYSLYALLLTAHITLVWCLPYFPTQDGPSHIYNLVILQDLLNGGQVWGEYYFSQLRAIPNLGFHIFAYPLLSLFSPATTEKLFISFYIILMAVGVPYLLRSFNRPIFPFSFFVFPVMFNFTIMMGFYSYSVAVPIFLLAFGYCYRIRNTSIFYKFTIYNLAGFAVYFMHLVAFGMFLLSLICIVLSESAGFKDKLKKLLTLALLLSPLTINLILYMHANSKDFGGIPSGSHYIELFYRIEDLLMFSSITLSHWLIGPGYLLFFLFAYFFSNGLYAGLINRLKNNHFCYISNNGLKCLLYLALALALICLFSPFRWGDGSFFNQRFPWVILLITLPLLYSPVKQLSPRFTMSILIFISVLSLSVNAAVMYEKSSFIEEFLKGLATDFTNGTYIMAYKADDDSSRISVLMHAASYYGLKKKVVVIGNFEATKDLFPVRFKTTLPSFPAIDQIIYDSKTINWEQFPAISYLLVWQPDDEAARDLTPFYKETYRTGNIAVWNRI